MFGELFDPNQEFSITEHLRPHWSQAGAVVFITFRTRDSIPREVLDRWDREKNEWLDCKGLLTSRHWSEVVDKLPEVDRLAFRKRFNRCREEFLDRCQGQCLLRRSELSKLVADSLLYFDGERYQMGDFVVMPNHVHFLAAFPTEAAMHEQCTSWLRFTAMHINRKIGETGPFWQREPFDHLVRSVEQFEYLRRYIADNPRKAGLLKREYHYYRRP